MRDYSFGNFLNELRLQRGLTQHQLGALVGVSDKAVSKWENGSSKPHSRLLYRLSEVLGISVDELLSCKYRSLEKKEVKGVFAMKKQLWSKAREAMHERYGNPAPLEITNRFLSEQAEMQDTDMIVYLHMLSTLSGTAKKQHQHIRVKGGTGASFIAYLLGATEIDPLKPHYYCPSCHKIFFDDSTEDGWDLAPRVCSCGKSMVGDGHDIPFETYRHAVRRNIDFDVSLAPGFMSEAVSIVKDYFKDCALKCSEQQNDTIVTLTVSSDGAPCSITLCADEELERYRALENATATCFDRIPFIEAGVLQEFQRGNTEGIREFGSPFVKAMLAKTQPRTFGDLIQVPGLSHGTGVWSGNGELLIEDGIPARHLIAYRDDVFNYIQSRILSRGLGETGLAYKIAEDTRRGIYSKNGIPAETRETLRLIGADDRFSDSIAKIKYLFPKAHGVTYVRSALILMWYKIHYPEEFNEIMI